MKSQKNNNILYAKSLKVESSNKYNNIRFVDYRDLVDSTNILDSTIANLASDILNTLKVSANSIATAESCTGGLVAYEFSKISGASSVFLGGIVSYQNSIKHKILGVGMDLIEFHTPYSIEVVNAMLKGAINAFDADFAIATSGVAGPSGGSEANPVGSVYIGVIKKNEIPLIAAYRFSDEIKSQKAESSRVIIQRKALESAMRLAYQYIVERK